MRGGHPKAQTKRTKQEATVVEPADKRPQGADEAAQSTREGSQSQPRLTF